MRGEVDPKTIILEARRRRRASLQSREERANLERLNTEQPKLNGEWADSESLLTHFRNRQQPRFFPGFSADPAPLHLNRFPQQTEELLNNARQIVDHHSWRLLGFGVKNFGPQIEWCKDPLSGYVWPLDYHRDITLIRNDGSDARVLWEVNRLGHLLHLACAYKVSRKEEFSRECLKQLSSWVEQNPYGRGINWTCAMEAALRSINLLAVFELLKVSSHFNSTTLSLFLRLFHQHGSYIKNNLEFSYISTSNHYLSDLAGLLWLGIMLPEFRDARSWSEFGLMEMLREMDKQVLPDGADFESSTSYHRFVLELFLYSFVLCRENNIQIEARYWAKLQLMLRYVKSYLRPDGLAPLIGDSDNGQVLPFNRRRADEHGHVLAIGATFLKQASLRSANHEAPPELGWVLGDEGLNDFQRLAQTEVKHSEAFESAGLYFTRHDDLYLSFNTSDAGLRGRGSHGHNDALSIEVAALGRTFIIDPGSYVYTADLRQRHQFRSTAYHSTAMIDGEDQNTTLESVPFVIGNEAKPRVLVWETKPDVDRVVAEHFGYLRLTSPVVHRRTVILYKDERYWLIEDDFLGAGEHVCEVRFHLGSGLDVQTQRSQAIAIDPQTGNSLSIISLDHHFEPMLEDQATSTDYGEKRKSLTACWRISGRLGKFRWKLVPGVISL